MSSESLNGIPLLPCPFCGKEACWNTGHHVVMCPDDNCPAGFVFVGPEEWNTRANPTPDLEALVEKMEDRKPVTCDCVADRVSEAIDDCIAIVKEHFKGSTQG